MVENQERVEILYRWAKGGGFIMMFYEQVLIDPSPCFGTEAETQIWL